MTLPSRNFVNTPLPQFDNTPLKKFDNTPLPKFGNTGNLLYYLISSRICAIFRVLLMLRNFRIASTSPLLTLSMFMEIIQPY